MLLPVLVACIVVESTVSQTLNNIKEELGRVGNSYDSFFGNHNPVRLVWDRDTSYNMLDQYTYTCQNNKCVRYPRSEEPFYQSIEACSLTCGKYGSLWPAPTKEVQLDPELVIFHPMYINFTKIDIPEKAVKDMMDEAIHYFMRKLHFKHPNYPQCNKGPFTEYEFRAIYGEKHPSHKESKSSRSSNSDSSSSSHKKRRSKRSGAHKQDESHGNNGQFQYNSERDRQRWQYQRMSPFNSKMEQTRGRWMPRNKVHIEISISSGNVELKLDTNESYIISIQTSSDTTTVSVSAKTYYGARHALETLTQMIEYCKENNALYIVKQATIKDEPAFRYRGIMLDTGHNYFSKDEILRLLDAMSANKLNSFHWHITDTTSFPLITNRAPNMPMYGAYSPQKIYTPMNVWEIVKYANQRGIRVVPEFSAPGNVGSGWKWDMEHDKMEKMVLCFDEDQPWYKYCTEPPCGQLNPVNQEVFNYLQRIYMDMIQYFNPEFFHMGGYGVSFKCWKQSHEISKHLKDAGKEATDEEMMELWNTFQEKAFAKLNEAYGKYRDDSVTPIYFSSPFSQKHLDSKRYIIQVTNAANDSEIESYIKNGYRVILSNYDVWSNAGPSHAWAGEREGKYPHISRPSWKQVYENEPLGHKEDYTSILGGETTIWSYATDDSNLQTTVWPLASAMAERLWSDPKSDANEAQHRMSAHRQRMVQEGVHAAVFEPEYCHRNPGICYSKEHQGGSSGSKHTDDDSHSRRSSSKPKTERKAVSESNEEYED